METCNSSNAPISSTGSHVVVRNTVTRVCEVWSYNNAPTGNYVIVFRGSRNECDNWKNTNCR